MRMVHCDMCGMHMSNKPVLTDTQDTEIAIRGGSTTEISKIGTRVRFIFTQHLTVLPDMCNSCKAKELRKLADTLEREYQQTTPQEACAEATASDQGGGVTCLGRAWESL